MSGGASPFVFATAQYESGDWDSAPLVPANVIDSLARYTALDVAPQGVVVPLASEALFRHPLVYMTGHLPVRFTAAERRNLRRFAVRGGILFVDDHNHDVDGVFHRTAVTELRDTFAEIGPLAPLSNAHALYRAFFTFAEGPPTTSHELNGWGDNLVHPQLHAVLAPSAGRRQPDRARIAVLYSNKDYSSEWNYHPDNKRFLSIDNTRFAVNLVVYALTH